MSCRFLCPRHRNRPAPDFGLALSLSYHTSPFIVGAQLSLSNPRSFQRRASRHITAAEAATMLAILATALFLCSVTAQREDGQYWPCNPMTNATGACTPNPGLPTSTYSVDFTQATAIPENWTLSNYANISFDPELGAAFTYAKRYDAPQLYTDFYIFFGRVSVEMRIANGTGMISSSVLISDVFDEIDFEFSGNNFNLSKTGYGQNNYFGKGITGSYNRGEWFNVSNPQEEFHTYTFDWSPELLQWGVDGAVIREFKYSESTTAVGSEYQFPQTPAKFQLGIWAGGDPGQNQGTIDWAGGITDVDGGPYTMYVKNVYIENYNPGAAYNYTDQSGSRQSIEILGAPVVDEDGTTTTPVVSSAAPTSTTGSTVSQGTGSSTTTVQSTSTVQSTQTVPAGTGAGSGSSGQGTTTTVQSTSTIRSTSTVRGTSAGTSAGTTPAPSPTTTTFVAGGGAVLPTSYGSGMPATSNSPAPGSSAAPVATSSPSQGSVGESDDSESSSGNAGSDDSGSDAGSGASDDTESSGGASDETAAGSGSGSGSGDTGSGSASADTSGNTGNAGSADGNSDNTGSSGDTGSTDGTSNASGSSGDAGSSDESDDSSPSSEASSGSPAEATTTGAESQPTSDSSEGSSEGSSNDSSESSEGSSDEGEPEEEEPSSDEGTADTGDADSTPTETGAEATATADEAPAEYPGYAAFTSAISGPEDDSSDASESGEDSSSDAEATDSGSGDETTSATTTAPGFYSTSGANRLRILPWLS